PLAGLGLAVGTALDALLGMALAGRGERTAKDDSRRESTRPLIAASAVVVALLAYAVVSDRLLGARVARRLPGIDLPFDRQLRKSDMIRRASEGLRRTGTPRRMVLYLPPESSSRLDQRTGRMYADTTLAIEDMLMVLVLDGGRALRALSPGLDSV